jgi:hypothetical protein
MLWYHVYRCASSLHSPKCSRPCRCADLAVVAAVNVVLDTGGSGSQLMQHCRCLGCDRHHPAPARACVWVRGVCLPAITRALLHK